MVHCNRKPSSAVVNYNSKIDDLLGNKRMTVTAADQINLSTPTNVDYVKLLHHLSFSSISNYMSCPYSFKLKYLDEIKAEKDGPSEHTEFGHVIHSTLEQYLKTREMPHLEGIKTNLNEMFSKLPNADKLKEVDWHDTIEPILSEMPEFMEKTFGTNWKYVASELPLMESIDGYDQLKFKGFIDGVIETTNNKKGEKLTWIIDYKTCSYFWPFAKRIDPKKTFQLVFYKYFYSRKFNIPMESIRCGFVLLHRTTQPGTHCLLVTVSVGEKTIEKALGTIDKMMAYTKKRMFPKNYEGCTYCAFRDTKYCTR